MHEYTKGLSWIFVIVGILYALQDYGVALNWWKFNWYTVIFLILGLAHLSGCCKVKKK